MLATKATLFPPSRKTNTAKAYDDARRSATPPQSLASSVDKMALLEDVPLEGFLVDVKNELQGFEQRMYEPTVGAFMHTSDATKGKLYRIRDDLERMASSP